MDSSNDLVPQAPANTPADRVPSTRRAHRWAVLVVREALVGGPALDNVLDLADLRVRASVDRGRDLAELPHRLMPGVRSALRHAAVHADHSSIRRPKKDR